MLKTLRSRLILSHILPLLIIIPIMGVALVYMLETQFLLPKITRDLVSMARILAVVTSQDERLWSDPSSAQATLPNIDKTGRSIRVMFINPEGRLLASSDPADASRLNEILNATGLANAQAGKSVTQTSISQRYQEEVIDVFEPVFNRDKTLVGIIRLSYQFDTVSDELVDVSYIIAVILFIGLSIGTLMGLFLAINIQRPIRQVTLAIFDLARGNRTEALPEEGFEEVRLLARSVNFLLARLKSLEQARGRLLANLIHELGRPLGALRVALQAIMKGGKHKPELLDELIPGMDEEAARLQHLLEDLADMHDQVLGNLELKREAVHSSEWLVHVLIPWKEVAYQKHLHWIENIPTDLPIIEADPMRLTQVIGNLVSNAIKYTPPRGSVTVSAGISEDMVWIRVSDTGPGIPVDEQEKIFTPFFRGNQGRRIKQGMGLGLSIARDLVLAHGGRLELESTPGLGSHFTVWLPATRPVASSK